MFLGKEYFINTYIECNMQNKKLTSKRYRKTQLKKLIREKEMATHSSIVAWKISWTDEPGGLVSGIAESYTT